MELMRTRPPPRDSPVTDMRVPSVPSIEMVTVLGWRPVPASEGTNSKSRPSSRASSNESRTRTSSGARPKIPATSARSVPCPRYVRANELYSVNVTRARGEGPSERATSAILSAPAVCEEEGPTMMGPRISNADVVIMARTSDRRRPPTLGADGLTRFPRASVSLFRACYKPCGPYFASGSAFSRRASVTSRPSSSSDSPSGGETWFPHSATRTAP